MFEKDGRTISLEEAQAAAERKGVSIEEWSANFGWTQGSEPGKTNDLAPTANAGSETMTAGGDSISVDTSLEQSKTNNQNGLNDFEKAKQDLNAIKITADEDTAIRDSIDIIDINAQIAAEKNISIDKVTDGDREAAKDKVIAEKRREALNVKIENIASEYSDGVISDWGMNLTRTLARMVPGADIQWIDKTFS